MTFPKYFITFILLSTFIHPSPVALALQLQLRFPAKGWASAAVTSEIERTILSTRPAGVTKPYSSGTEKIHKSEK